MINKYPLWKYLLVLFFVLLGFFYAAPNLYPPDPALQISPLRTADSMDERALTLATDTLEAAGVGYFGAEIQEGKRAALIRLEQGDDQLPAKAVIERALGDDYVVALNLAPTTPDWLTAFGAEPMKLGLDLSGGVHFKLEVDTEAPIAKRLETDYNSIRKSLRQSRVRGRVELEEGVRILGSFPTEERRNEAVSVVRKDFPELVLERGEEGENFTFSATLSELTRTEIAQYAVQQNLSTIRNRVNELGVSEPLVQPQGRNRIVVELPGVQDPTRAKIILGKTANLEFRLVARADAPLTERQEFQYRSAAYGGRTEWLEREVIITGINVTDARASFDQNGMPNVNIRLDSDGGTLMNRATAKNIKRRMGVLFIERETKTRYETGPDGEEKAVKTSFDVKRVITAPVIQSALGVQFQITGLDSPQEASELALLLRAGALAAPIEFVEERTIGPSLGAENIAKGFESVQYGLLAVVLFMIVYYRVFGIAAVIALTCNLVLLVACMSLFGATLTLPGIAGIVLTVGMAVDANVLIFARIREELRNGLSPQMAIHAGFERAVVTILDANLTTLIVAIILFAVGTGPVKGFAVTLMFGLATSMFTAIFGTRALVNLIYGGRNVKRLAIG